MRLKRLPMLVRQTGCINGQLFWCFGGLDIQIAMVIKPWRDCLTPCSRPFCGADDRLGAIDLVFVIQIHFLFLFSVVAGYSGVEAHEKSSRVRAGLDCQLPTDDCQLRPCR
jgi:hypothetical protein